MPTPAAPSSHVVHHPCLSPSLSPSPPLPLPLPFPNARSAPPLDLALPFERVFVDRNWDDAPSGFVLAYDSGGSANEMRLGVDAPDEPPLRVRSPSPNRLGTLSRDGDGDGEGMAGVIGVEGPAERFFIDDCFGGEAARVEVVCRGFVNSLDIEAVAFDVPDTGGAAEGDRRDGLGRGGVDCVDGALPLPEDCEAERCFSRIWRRDSTVRSTWRVADSEEVEEVDSSSIGGVNGRGWRGAGDPRMGVEERERRIVGDELEDASRRSAGGGDLDIRGRFTVFALLLDERRRRLEEGGEEEAEADRGMTYDASISAALLWCSTDVVAGTRSCSDALGVCAKAPWLGTGVGGRREEARTPSVDGRLIKSAASEESIYIVRARGAGATKSLRSCTESCKLVVDCDGRCCLKSWDALRR